VDNGWVLVISVLLLAISIVGFSSSCSSQPTEVTPEQIKVINSQLDTLHEEVAAANSGGAWLVLVLAATIFAPIFLAMLILVQADRTAIHSDEVLLQLGRHGLGSEIVDASRVLQKPATPVKLPRMPRLRLIGAEKQHRTDEKPMDESDEVA
jgi:hypothetical protein